MHRFILAGLVLVAVTRPAWSVAGEGFAQEPALAQRTDIVGFWGFEAGGEYGTFCSSDSDRWRTGIYGSAWSPNCTRNSIVTGIEAFSGNTRKVHYPAGTFGPADNGDNWPIAFDRVDNMPVKRYDSLYFRYYLRFCESFDYRLGGKLPGLVGGNNWSRSGGNQPDGTNGWTTRYMWGSGGRVNLYAYLPPEHNPGIMTSQWGSSVAFNYDNGGVPRALERGVWHCIEQFVRINDVGQSNGVIRCWLNGEEALVLDDVVFRTVANGENQVGAIYFSTFHGGGSLDWAPDTTGYIYYDNLVVAHNYIGPIVTAPTVMLSDEHDGATLQQGQFALFSAQVADDVTAVTFVLNGIEVGVDSAAPFEHIQYLTPGEYVLRARAVNDRMLKSGSAPLRFTVAAAPAPTPDRSLTPIHDAYVRGGTHADKNHGTGNHLVLKTESNPEYTREIHLKFDVSGIGPIAGARLRLYCTQTNKTVRAAVHVAHDNGWTRETVTWNTAPAAGAVIVTVPVDQGGAWYTFDITGHMTLGDVGDTLSLVLRDALSSGGWTMFAAAESGSNGPVLEIVEGTASHKGYTAAGHAWPIRVAFVQSGSGMSIVVHSPVTCRYAVHDMAGRLHARGSVGGATSRIELPTLAGGVVLVSLSAGGRMLHQRVLSWGGSNTSSNAF